MPPLDPPAYNNMVESGHEDIGMAPHTSGWKEELSGSKVLQLTFLLLGFTVLLGFHSYHYQFDTPEKLRMLCEEKSRLLVLLDLAFPSVCGYIMALLYYLYYISESEQNLSLDFFVTYWMKVLGLTCIVYMYGLVFNFKQGGGVYHCKLLNLAMNNTLKGWEFPDAEW